MQTRLDSKLGKLTSDVDVLKRSVGDQSQELSQHKASLMSLQDNSVKIEKDLYDLQVHLSQSGHLTYSLEPENSNSIPQAQNLILSSPHEHLLPEPTKKTIKKQFPKDCHEVYKRGYRVNGEYHILPQSMSQLQSVYCQMINNTGYTLLQRRIDGTLNFNRRWLEYEQGFGNPYAETWLGNQLIHRLTMQKQYILRIDMWDWEGQSHYAEYSTFLVSGEEDSYRLHIGGYSGTAGDSLLYHNKMAFSTEDADNDLHERHCAAENKGGWWYRSCFSSQLNGIYHTAWYTQNSYADGIAWYTLKDNEFYSLKKVEMKIRPVVL